MIDVTQALPNQLCDALNAAGFHDISLTAMDGTGVSHDHFKISDSGWILRVPKLSQLGLDAETQLKVQAAAFQRAAPSGATPKIKVTLPVSDTLPRGGLIIEHIVGRAPRAPSDLPTLARALAAVHGLRTPMANARSPIQTYDNPFTPIFAAATAAIERYLPGSSLSTKARATMLDRLAWLADKAKAPLPQAHSRLTLSDTHPGNFIIQPNGDAVFVDLEKPAYSSPTIDLAHAVIGVAAGWDPVACMQLTPTDRQAFIDAWQEAAPDDLVAACQPLLLPMRQAVWLRTISFFLKWREESAMQGPWSAERLGANAAKHFLSHIEHSLSEQAIISAAEDWS